MAASSKLHIVMFPWLAFGHIIPYFELSKCLAQTGHLISFISTPRIIDSLPTVPQDLNINLVKLTPPHVNALPEDAQCTIDVPVRDIHRIKKLLDGLDEPFSTFLKDHPSVDWIVYDMFVYWAPGIADKFRIPSVFFCPSSAATLVFVGPPSAILSSDFPSLTAENLTVPPPWVPFPTTVAYRYHDAMHIVKGASGGDSGVTERYRLGITFQGCHVVAVRSSPEFEPEWMKLLGDIYQKPAFPVGLLSSSVHEINSCKNDTWVDQEWLDTQKQGSTVYVAFGSELRLSKEYVHELAFGLELSELPFFWAYRGDPCLLPDGFEDRTKCRGLIRTGWSPQARLLAHPSIGGFLMHGGWGSASECLAFGKPLIMLPFIGDQGLNVRLLEEKKVGIEVDRNDTDGSFTRDAVTKCLKMVMVDDEGAGIRASAREMKSIFGSKEKQDRYVEDFVNYLIEHRPKEGVRAPSD
ncbi:UDP-glycosyltransferase 91C1-like [Magnolia sinica]|uniref:UDP-glycosyltransferase 91C1-like n=1 Tax=Magnolia sinica TaxID=86752 RepID=UPI00265B4F9E|nr:UDP-glycosyltransferase 91C1-like [Magnolia sinica]